MTEEDVMLEKESLNMTAIIIELRGKMRKRRKGRRRRENFAYLPKLFMLSVLIIQ
jgi:hypothetical protein